MRSGPSKQRGVAALLALLIFSVGVILAVDLQFDAYLARRQAAALLYRDVAFHYLTGAESWAREILDEDLRDGRGDDLSENWARQLPALPIDGGSLSGRMFDLQGRFNLNNLALLDETQHRIQLDQFRRLLRHLGLEERIAQAVTDWVDMDRELSFPDGAERDHYMGGDPAYGTPDMPITTVSELLAVRGIDAQTYNVLEPHVAALPPGTEINVNTATAAVIASLADDLDPGTAERLVADRPESGYQDLESFKDRLGTETEVPIGLDSQNFLLRTDAVLGTIGITMYSHLHRPGSGVTVTLSRSINAL